MVTQWSISRIHCTGFIVSIRVIEILHILISQFVLGGYTDGYVRSSKASKFEEILMDGNMWTEAGTSLSSRKGHRSIVIGDTIMHIGGGYTQQVAQP